MENIAELDYDSVSFWKEWRGRPIAFVQNMGVLEWDDIAPAVAGINSSTSLVICEGEGNNPEQIIGGVKMFLEQLQGLARANEHRLYENFDELYSQSCALGNINFAPKNSNKLTRPEKQEFIEKFLQVTRREQFGLVDYTKLICTCINVHHHQVALNTAGNAKETLLAFSATGRTLADFEWQEFHRQVEGVRLWNNGDTYDVYYPHSSGIRGLHMAVSPTEPVEHQAMRNRENALVCVMCGDIKNSDGGAVLKIPAANSTPGGIEFSSSECLTLKVHSRAAGRGSSKTLASGGLFPGNQA